MALSRAARVASVQAGPRGSFSIASGSKAAFRALLIPESAAHAVDLATINASLSSAVRAFSAAIWAP